LACAIIDRAYGTGVFRGLMHRGKLDGNDALVKFCVALEEATIKTVEARPLQAGLSRFSPFIEMHTGRIHDQGPGHLHTRSRGCEGALHVYGGIHGQGTGVFALVKQSNDTMAGHCRSRPGSTPWHAALSTRKASDGLCSLSRRSSGESISTHSVSHRAYMRKLSQRCNHTLHIRLCMCLNSLRLCLPGELSDREVCLPLHDSHECLLNDMRTYTHSGVPWNECIRTAQRSRAPSCTRLFQGRSCRHLLAHCRSLGP
jgi:hypothetical protein